MPLSRMLILRNSSLNYLLELHRDQRGQMAIAVMLILVLVIMFALFAFTAGVWYLDHRLAQNQAEMAAHAAALHLPATDTAAADAWLIYNGSIATSDQSCPRSGSGNGLQFGHGRPFVPGPDAKGRYTTVRICVRRQSLGLFSGLASGIPFVYVSAMATAQIFEETSLYSLMAMNPTKCKSLYVHGPNVTIGNGGATYTRSSCCPEALLVSGTSSSLVAGQNDLAGGCGTTNGGATLEETPTQSAGWTTHMRTWYNRFPAAVLRPLIPYPQSYRPVASVRSLSLLTLRK